MRLNNDASCAGIMSNICLGGWHGARWPWAASAAHGDRGAPAGSPKSPYTNLSISPGQMSSEICSGTLPSMWETDTATHIVRLTILCEHMLHALDHQAACAARLGYHWSACILLWCLHANMQHSALHAGHSAAVHMPHSKRWTTQVVPSVERVLNKYAHHWVTDRTRKHSARLLTCE